MIELARIHKGHVDLRAAMEHHYSNPRGFVGRQLIYRIDARGDTFGFIAAGSATRFLPGRESDVPLNCIVNNTFFHVERPTSGYPLRNFTSAVVRLWRERVLVDWLLEYGDLVLAYETLVEIPRTGELYRRDGWTFKGTTKGETCKRVAGKGTDSWSGKRVWDRVNLRPKNVFVRGVHP